MRMVRVCLTGISILFNWYLIHEGVFKKRIKELHCLDRFRRFFSHNANPSLNLAPHVNNTGTFLDGSLLGGRVEWARQPPAAAWQLSFQRSASNMFFVAYLIIFL